MQYRTLILRGNLRLHGLMLIAFSSRVAFNDKSTG